MKGLIQTATIRRIQHVVVVVLSIGEWWIPMGDGISVRGGHQVVNSNNIPTKDETPFRRAKFSKLFSKQEVAMLDDHRVGHQKMQH